MVKSLLWTSSFLKACPLGPTRFAYRRCSGPFLTVGLFFSCAELTFPPLPYFFCSTWVPPWLTSSRYL